MLAVKTLTTARGVTTVNLREELELRAKFQFGGGSAMVHPRVLQRVGGSATASHENANRETV
jgi:hypothetical protein